jgi:hypothetical protein
MTRASTSVVRSVTVAVGQEPAFEVYTARFGTWWPKEHPFRDEADLDLAGLGRVRVVAPVALQLPGVHEPA